MPNKWLDGTRGRLSAEHKPHRATLSATVVRIGNIARHALPLAAVAAAIASAATLAPWISAMYEERDLLCVSRVYKARSDLRILDIVVKDWRARTGRWPTALSDLVPNYVRRISLDPWGRAYLYRQDLADAPPNVFSLGADGGRGGTGENTDLSSVSPLESVVEEIHRDRCRK